MLLRRAVGNCGAWFSHYWVWQVRWSFVGGSPVQSHLPSLTKHVKLARSAKPPNLSIRNSTSIVDCPRFQPWIIMSRSLFCAQGSESPFSTVDRISTTNFSTVSLDLSSTADWIKEGVLKSLAKTSQDRIFDNKAGHFDKFTWPVDPGLVFQTSGPARLPLSANGPNSDMALSSRGQLG